MSGTAASFHPRQRPERGRSRRLIGPSVYGARSNGIRAGVPDQFAENTEYAAGARSLRKPIIAMVNWAIRLSPVTGESVLLLDSRIAIGDPSCYFS